MIANYTFQYSKKQLKDIKDRRSKPVVVGVLFNLCVPAVISLILGALYLIAMRISNSHLRNFVFDCERPLVIYFGSLWLVIWLVVFIYMFFFANESESYYHADSEQTIQINDKQAILTINSKNGVIQEKFFVKKIKQKKNYLVIYKSIRSFVQVPIDVVNQASEKEAVK